MIREEIKEKDREAVRESRGRRRGRTKAPGNEAGGWARHSLRGIGGAEWRIGASTPMRQPQPRPTYQTSIAFLVQRASHEVDAKAPEARECDGPGRAAPGMGFGEDVGRPDVEEKAGEKTQVDGQSRGRHVKE